MREFTKWALMALGAGCFLLFSLLFLHQVYPRRPRSDLLHRLPVGAQTRECPERLPNQSLFETLLESSPSTFVLLEPPQTPKQQLLILVPLRVTDRPRRDQIRSLWASPLNSNALKNGTARVIFVVGAEENEEKSNNSGMLDVEAVEYEDILQIGIREEYLNLVYKIAVAFRWSLLSSAEWIMKVDADSAVHIDRLIHNLPSFSQNDSNSSIWCYVHTNLHPFRDPCHPKWHVPYSVFPEQEYPHFCSGPLYLTKRDALHRIMEYAAKLKVIEVEDVFFTGLAARAANINRIGVKDHFGIVFKNHSTCDSAGTPSLCALCAHPSDWSKRLKEEEEVPQLWDVLTNPRCNATGA